MGFLRRFLKPRKHPRYYTTNKSLVVVSPYTSDAKDGKQFQLLDISEGGCAFIYDGIKEGPKEMGFLSLVADATSCLESVNFITVSDTSLQGTLNTSGGFRRRGVKFTRLGLLNREHLKEFIEQHSICRIS